MILFFLPGILLNFLIFRSASLLERTVYSLVLGTSLVTISGMLLASLSLFTELYLISSLSFLSLVFSLLLFWKGKKGSRTKYDGVFLLLFVIAVAGALWRLYLVSDIPNFGNAYGYSFYLIEKSVLENHSIWGELPRLNLYTGMVLDHAKYPGGTLASLAWRWLSGSADFLRVFFAAYILCGFSYIVVNEFTERRDLALIASLVLAAGPVEIWHMTLNFFGHFMIFPLIFSLFLVFRRNERAGIYLILPVSLAALMSYYTAAVVMLLSSMGFILAL